MQILNEGGCKVNNAKTLFIVKPRSLMHADFLLLYVLRSLVLKKTRGWFALLIWANKIKSTGSSNYGVLWLWECKAQIFLLFHHNTSNPKLLAAVQSGACIRNYCNYIGLLGSCIYFKIVVVGKKTVFIVFFQNSFKFVIVRAIVFVVPYHDDWERGRLLRLERWVQKIECPFTLWN